MNLNNSTEKFTEVCLECGNTLFWTTNNDGSINTSSTDSSITFDIITLVSDETFFQTFDKIDSKLINISELEIEYGFAKEPTPKNNHRCYQIGNLQSQKFIFVNLTELVPKQLTRHLLESFNKIAEKTKSENIYVVISRQSPVTSSIIRSLGMFGFESVKDEEAKLFVSKADKIVMKMEISQEDDFLNMD